MNIKELLGVVLREFSKVDSDGYTRATSKRFSQADYQKYQGKYFDCLMEEIEKIQNGTFDIEEFKRWSAEYIK